MRSLLHQQIDGALLRLTVNAYVGDGVKPELCGGLDGGEFGQLEAVEEILFDIAHAGFDAPLLIATSNVARFNGKAMVAGEIEVTRIEHRCDAGQALQDCRFKIVDQNFGRHTAKRREGVFVAGEKMLHRLRDGELDIHLTAESQHHDEERKPTPRIANGDASEGAPVGLCALAASKMQLQIDRALRRANTVDVVAQDADAAGDGGNRGSDRMSGNRSRPTPLGHGPPRAAEEARMS